MIRTRLVSRKFLRPVLLGLGSLVLALVSGCKLADVFSLSGPQSTYLTEGPVAEHQWKLFMVTVYVTTFIFIVVGAVLAYAQIKFRAKSDADEHLETPPQGHGNPLVEIGLIVGSVVLLVIIAIPTLKDIWYTHDVPEAEKADAMDVTATGYQWWFKFDYSSEKIQTAMGEQNLATGNELVVPVGKPVRVQLRTVDVIHSFWIPKLAGKVDMIPNRPNFLWFKADHAGYFYGQCAEYCGDSHAIMRFRVIALEKDAYARWLANQKQPARSVTTADASREHVEFASLTSSTAPATGPGSALIGEPSNSFKDWQNKQNPGASEDPALIATGRKLFSEKTCISCHTIRGHDGIGITGPELTHVGARSSIAAGSLENSPERMHQWIKDPNYFKPGNKMFNGGYMDVDTGKLKFSLNDQEIDALVAYLQSLK